MRDLKVEGILDRSRVQYTLGSIMIKAVVLNPRESRYQARVTTKQLDEETVELYVMAMRNGADFPAIVVNVRDDGRYDILGGYHRANAARRAGKDSIAAYVLRVDAPEADRICRILNTVEAVHGADRSERIAHARRLMAHQGYSMRRAADEVGVSLSVVSGAVRADAVRARLAKFMDPSALSETHLSMVEVVRLDTVLHALAYLIRDAKLGTDATRVILSDIGEARSEQDQLAAIASHRNSPLIQERMGHVKRGASVRDSNRPTRRVSTLLRGISLVNRQLVSYATPARMGVTEQELDAVRKEWGALARRMESFLGQTSVLPEGGGAGGDGGGATGPAVALAGRAG